MAKYEYYHKLDTVERLDILALAVSSINQTLTG